MLSNDPKIKELMYENAVKKLADIKGITLAESREAISSISFKQYVELLEAGADIVPPSGQPIAAQQTQQQKPQAASKSPDKNVKAIWPGVGAPVEVGMAVGIRDIKGAPANAVVTQVDKSANGVKVKTLQGKDEWYNMGTLQPGMATNKPGAPTTAPTTESKEELLRLRKLAGITETCTPGASSAANMSVGVVEMGDGNTIRRQTNSEKRYTKQYTPESAPKTIIGDTKPNQASGELSARLVKRGLPTATRKNNGFKR